VKKSVAILFLSLYVYNLAGYYVVFKSLQYQVRNEIKLRIKESVPHGELFLIAIKKGEEESLHWLDDHEFRYRGSMYDIVRQYSRNDTVFYSCVNDTQEEFLFENLDFHVAMHSQQEGVPAKADLAFKGIVKDYVPLFPVVLFFPGEGIAFGIASPPPSASQVPDVPTPPPRCV
jgi:hypothetical protein